MPIYKGTFRLTGVPQGACFVREWGGGSRSNPFDAAMEKEWRAIPDETGHYREETLPLP